MKRKNNQVKVGPFDIRCGNMIYHDEPDFIKIQDINGIVSQRINKHIAKGQVLEIAMKAAKTDEKQMRFLENYAVVSFNYLSCVPDAELLAKVNEASCACIERHPEIYGIKKDISEKEDSEIIKEERELKEAVDEAQKEIENESAGSED